LPEDWHGPGSATAGSAPRPSPARAEAGALRITVDDPVKKAEAGLIPGYSSGYVLYRVQTVSKLRSYRSQHASVRRRFRDFVVRGCACSTRGCLAPHVSVALDYGTDCGKFHPSSWGATFPLRPKCYSALLCAALYVNTKAMFKWPRKLINAVTPAM